MPLKKLLFSFGDLIQLSGLVLLGMGICLEIVFQGPLFLILITLGSVIFAIGTKLKGK